MTDTEHDWDGLRASAGVAEPLRLASSGEIVWHFETDLAVIGFGGAGACAAIEALDHGLRVALIDRFEGGGATAISGSVMYAGGGTKLQKQLGIEDSPENMRAYLAHEVGDVVSPETLKHFCDTSVECNDWVQENGVRYQGKAYAHKTTYPPAGYSLYYSGNELNASRTVDSTPAPRGHIAKGIKSWSAFGPAFFRPLGKSALKKGAVKIFQSRARRLVIDKTGRVIGVEIARIPANSWAGFMHRRYSRWSGKLHMVSAPLADKLRKRLARLEAEHAQIEHVRAKRGVVISTGGFIFNRTMVKHFAPKYRRTLRLGTTGDTGAGILLGHSVGGALDLMEHASAWRFINPPASWPKTALVNRSGARYVDETLYGASIGAPMFEDHEGQAILIMDNDTFEHSKTEVSRKTARPITILQTRLAFKYAAKSADTLEGLAKRIKADPATLQATVDAYNAAARGEAADRFGKEPAQMAEIKTAPFHAVDMSAGAGGATPCITLGGLKVDEASGAVLRSDGTTVPGLYAAGRSAIGIASNIYLGGLSLADGVYSGRRAGRSAALSE